MDAEIDRLIALHADKAYAVALRLTGNPADAGDVVQEAFLRAMKYFATYDPSLPFEAWLNQILRNVYLTYLRKEASRRSVSLTAKADEDSASLEDALADTGPGPERWAEARDAGDRVQDALPGHLTTPPLRLAVRDGRPRSDPRARRPPPRSAAHYPRWTSGCTAGAPA